MVTGGMRPLLHEGHEPIHILKAYRNPLIVRACMGKNSRREAELTPVHSHHNELALAKARQ